MPDHAPLETVAPVDPMLNPRALAPLLPLAAALLAAVVMYWPALDSPFFADDYNYLVAARDEPTGGYLRDTLVPGSETPNLPFTEEFWRPLYFLSWKALWPAFGDQPAAYHLVNLAVHLATVVVVWCLARNLTASSLAAGLCASAFAVFPVGYDSISWIASFNSIAFPLALLSWLAFMRAAALPHGRSSITFHAAAVLLLAVALGFRETAAVVGVPIALWYALVARPRAELGHWRAWLPLVPLATLGVLYVAARTLLAPDWATPGSIFEVHAGSLEKAWFYIKLGPIPIPHPEQDAVVFLQRAAGAALLAAIPLAAIFRRWLFAILLLTYVAAILPLSTLTLGVSARYMYFPSVFLVLATGQALVDVSRALAIEARPRLQLAAWGGATAIVLAAGVAIGQHRVEVWERDSPGVHEAWVVALRQAYPELPSGSTLYVTGVPLVLALRDGVFLEPTVRFYYPGVEEVVLYNPFDPAGPQPPPGARVFIYQP